MVLYTDDRSLHVKREKFGCVTLPLSVTDSIAQPLNPSHRNLMSTLHAIANLLPLTGVDVLGPSEVSAPYKKDVSISLSMLLVISTSLAVIAVRVFGES